MKDKRRRQSALLRLIRQERVSSQAEIVSRLAGMGFAATQASVSRDLRELGLIKVGGRYVPAGRVVGRAPAPADGPVSELITDVAAVGANLVVVRTREGAASAVAVELDHHALPEVAGTLAGDDTIFVAVRSRSAQGRVVAMLRGLTLGRRQA